MRKPPRIEKEVKVKKTRYRIKETTRKEQIAVTLKASREKIPKKQREKLKKGARVKIALVEMLRIKKELIQAQVRKAGLR